MGNVLFAIDIFGIWFICRGDISSWTPIFRFLAHLLGIGLPLYFLYEPLSYWIGNYIKTRIIENSAKRLFKANIEAMSNAQQQTVTPQADTLNKSFYSKTLLTTAQISQLNLLRSQVVLDEIRHFPLIRVSGSEMPNLVSEAGIFTAKIKRYGNIQNLIVMLSTVPAISDFQRICNCYGALPKDFWAEGYLLPSREGICYAILFVTAFRLCGKHILF